MSEYNSLIYGHAINFIVQASSASKVLHVMVGSLFFMADGWEEGQPCSGGTLLTTLEN